MNPKLKPIYEQVKILMQAKDFECRVALAAKEHQQHHQCIILKGVPKGYRPAHAHYELGLRVSQGDKTKMCCYMELHLEGEPAAWLFQKLTERSTGKLPENYAFFDNKELKQSKSDERTYGIRHKDEIPLDEAPLEDIAQEVVARLEDMEAAVGEELRRLF
jgi:hypothetical protein